MMVPVASWWGFASVSEARLFFYSDVSDCLVHARQDGALAEYGMNRSFFVLPNGSIRHCPAPWDFDILIPLLGVILCRDLTDGHGFNT